MKKHLLALLSWSMLFFGAVSMTSCGDDDDDDDKTEVKTASIVGTWVVNEAESFSTADDDDLDDEESWNEITFNADGTFSAFENGKVAMSGTYALNGTEFEMTYGGMTIKKGAVIMDEEFMGIAVKVTMTECSLVLNGDKMTITQGILSESMGFKSEDKEITVLNRKK